MKKILLLILCLFTSTILSGCVRASWFSEEQHIKIVDKIIQKKYIKEGMTYELRPLYDENDNTARTYTTVAMQMLMSI